jgi:hypothetical protein
MMYRFCFLFLFNMGDGLGGWVVVIHCLGGGKEANCVDLNLGESLPQIKNLTYPLPHWWRGNRTQTCRKPSRHLK